MKQISTNNFPSNPFLQVRDFGRETLCGPSLPGLCAFGGDPYYDKEGNILNAPGTWQLQTASVPEPTSTLLLGAALLGFALRRRQA